MNTWMFIAILAFILVIIGLLIFWKKRANLSTTPKSTYMVSIFLPFLFAFMYADTLISDFFPGLTFLDFGVFYFLGAISGFFLALYLQRREIRHASK
jgi:hypothetical protein